MAHTYLYVNFIMSSRTFQERIEFCTPVTLAQQLLMFFHFLTHSHRLTWILSHDRNKTGGRISAISDGIDVTLSLLYLLKKTYWNVSEGDVCYGYNFQATLVKSFTDIKNLLLV